MTTQILNLDEIETPVQKTVKIGGKAYKMKPVSVADYIRSLKRMKDIDVETNPEQIVEAMTETVTTAFPDMPSEVVEGLNMDQLRALTEFISQEAEKEASEGNES